MELFTKNDVGLWPVVTLTLDQVSQNLINWSLTMSNHSLKFHKDLITSFWVILLTEKQREMAEVKKNKINNQMQTKWP